MKVVRHFLSPSELVAFAKFIHNINVKFDINACECLFFVFGGIEEFFAETFTKLQVLELTESSQVLLLDLD